MTTPTVQRRTLLTGLLGVTALGVAGCGGAAGESLAAAAPLPSTVPPDTRLAIAIHPTQVALEASGEIGKLPFTVTDWPNLSAGPDIIQGFRARSIDLASNAGIPPIQAAEALALEEELDRLIRPEYALRQLAQTLNVDPSSLRLEEELPDGLPDEDQIEGAKSRYTLIVELARRERLTVRRLIGRLGARTFPDRVRGTDAA